MGEALEQSADYGIRLMGFLDDEPGQIQLAQTYERYPLSRLPELLRQHVIDEIIFAVDSSRLAEMEEIFLLCDEEGVRTRVVVDFFPHVNSQVYLDRLGTTPLLTFSAAPHDEIRLLLKRVTDMVLAAAALVLLLPFMLLIALLIRLTSPGPAIFRQERCGLNGRRFAFYKFRSMCDNAEELKASVMHLNRKIDRLQDSQRSAADARWAGSCASSRSTNGRSCGTCSRATCRWWVRGRRCPKKWNCIKRWQRRRLRMRPGLTCLWAVAGRDSLDFETWMKMDMQYIDNWSLALDWKIILRTIPRVLTGKGAS